MSAFSVPFGYNWEVRTPVVDRTMHREFVDAFFQNGSLRLSSFETFRKHPNEARRDKAEGKAAMKIALPKGTLSAITVNGQESYVLCGSMVEASQSTSHAAIRILDTIAFAATVARQIPGFIGGTEGACVYRSNTFYEATADHDIAPPVDGEDPEQWARRQKAFVGAHMINKFFIKHSDYSAESEYRMLWFCDGMPRPFIDISCPKAIQFCERVGT